MCDGKTVPPAETSNQPFGRLLGLTTSHTIVSFPFVLPVTGWRLGWMVVPEALVEPINRLQQNMFINAPTISQTAALKCWDAETLQELQGHVEKYRTSRTLILEQLAAINELDPKMIAPADGGFYVYIDLGEDNVSLPGCGSVEER